MRFLVDESTGLAIALFLSAIGYDALSVYEVEVGASDSRALSRTAIEDRILVTSDKDFGDLVFREGHAHAGVILVRLADQRLAVKIDVLTKILKLPQDLTTCSVVASEKDIRRRAIPGRSAVSPL